MHAFDVLRATRSAAVLLSMRYRSWALTRHRGGDDCSDLLRRFDKVRIGKVGVARRGAMPVVPEKSTDERQTFARHNRLTCGGMAQVMQAQAAELRIRADRAPASSKTVPVLAPGAVRSRQMPRRCDPLAYDAAG